MMKSDSQYERELRKLLEKQGWLVIRSAGSLAFDLIAIKPQETRVIEVKADRGDRYYTTNNKDQYDSLNKLARNGYNCHYYVRWKGRRKGNQWESWELPLQSYPIFREGEGKPLNKS